MTEFMEMGETLTDIATACDLVGHDHGGDLSRAVAFIIEERGQAAALLRQVYDMSLVRGLPMDDTIEEFLAGLPEPAVTG